MAQVEPAASAADAEAMSFELPLEVPTIAEAPAAPVPASRDLSLDFDLGGISLDLDAPAARLPRRAFPARRSRWHCPIWRRQATTIRSSASSNWPRSSARSATSTARGTCCEEVIAQTGGAIQAKAHSMLDRLG